MLRRNMSTADCQKSGVEGKRLGLHSALFSGVAMETHDLTTKMMVKIAKIARNCESWANGGKTNQFQQLFERVLRREPLLSVALLRDRVPPKRKADRQLV